MDCTEDICHEIKPSHYRSYNEDVVQCPPDRSDLGRAGWTLLHSAAAHYPEDPTEDDKKHYSSFFSLVQYVYPCRSCASHYASVIETDPPQVDSRKSLVLWLCRVHNATNKDIGKPEFPCELKQLEERWVKGPSQCYSSLNEEDDDSITY